jgi:hypothetical protein
VGSGKLKNGVDKVDVREKKKKKKKNNLGNMNVVL